MTSTEPQMCWMCGTRPARATDRAGEAHAIYCAECDGWWEAGWRSADQPRFTREDLDRVEIVREAWRTTTRARVRALNAHLGTVRLAVSAEWQKDRDGEWYTVSVFDLDDGPDSMPISEAWGGTLREAVSDAFVGLDLGGRLDPASVVPF